MTGMNPETRAAGVSRIGTLPALIGLLRLPEWTKNLFVFAPLLFSRSLLNAAAVWTTVLVCAALCAVSSSVYIINDLLDIAKDRAHPVKRLRPIASGAIAPGVAGVWAILLIAVGYGLLAVARAPASVRLLTTGYLVLNAAYSLYLKQKVIVDVLAIAVGFVLRVLIGGAAVGVHVTHCLLLCTFLLATFLGFSKRRHELWVMGSVSTQTRPVLNMYSEEFLDRVSILTLAMTLTCYVLYTIAPDTIARLGTDALVYSTLIVMFALFRYLFLIHVKRMGSPVEALYHDRQIVLAIVCWVFYVVWVVYTWPQVMRFR